MPAPVAIRVEQDLRELPVGVPAYDLDLHAAPRIGADVEGLVFAPIAAEGLFDARRAPFGLLVDFAEGLGSALVLLEREEAHELGDDGVETCVVRFASDGAVSR